MSGKYTAIELMQRYRNGEQIINGDPYGDPHTRYDLAKRGYGVGMDTSSPEVSRPLYMVNYLNQHGVQFPWQPRSYVDLYWLADNDPVIRMCILNIRNEIFRNGAIIKPRFWGRCDMCDEEYDQKPPDAMNVKEREFNNNGFPCPECYEGTLWPPIKEQRRILKQYLKCANNNTQSLIEVLKQFEDDLQKADDGYLIILKDYKRLTDGQLEVHIREILRADPTLMRIVSDERGERGNELFTCLYHREYMTESPNERCSVSGCREKELYGVHYVSTATGTTDVEQAYIEGEVIHKSKYRPSLLYGYSVLLTCWYLAISNINMTRFIADYYDKRQIPKGMIAFPGISFESVKRMWEDWQAKLRTHPNYTPIFQLPVGMSGSVPEPKFIEFLKGLKEMEYIEVRNEFRLRISALYGVSPIFQGDLSTGGGLNNEGMQLTVTNRTVEFGQSIYNTTNSSPGIFEDLCMMLGVTDWIYELPAPIEEDKVSPHVRKQMKLTNAEMAQRLGFIIELPEEGLTDENDFIITGKSLGQQQMELSGTTIPGMLQPALSEESTTTGGEMDDSGEDMDVNDDDKADETFTHSHSHKHGTVTHDHDHKHHIGTKFDQHNHSHEGTGAGVIVPNQTTKQFTPDRIDELSQRFVTNLIQTWKHILKFWLLNELFKDRDKETISQSEVNAGLDYVNQLHGEINRTTFEQFMLGMMNLSRKYVLDTQGHIDELIPATNLETLFSSARADDITIIMNAYQHMVSFQRAFQDVSLEVYSNLREFVVTNFDNYDLESLVSHMSNFIDHEEWKLLRIARSESNRFAIAGAEIGFRELELATGIKFKYYWQVTMDHRTSNLCRAIHYTENHTGMYLDDLIALIKSLMRIYNPGWDDWHLPHPNCRSILRKV